jgi:hypothetical protein
VGAVKFEGHEGRQCGEHRTLGGRAWCYDCTSYCYPEGPCFGCEIPKLRAEIEELKEEVEGLRTEVKAYESRLGIDL